MKKIDNLWLPDEEFHMIPRYERDGGFDTEIVQMGMLLAPASQAYIAIDGGAHVGSCALTLATRFNHVLAFEPYPSSFLCLQENVKENTRVNPYEKALGAALGTTGLEVRAIGSTGSVRCIPNGNTPVTTIDAEAGKRPVAFIKLDLEGMDYFGILGGLQTIIHYHPVIVHEQKPIRQRFYQLTGEEISDLLRELGYKMVHHIGVNMIWTWATNA